MLATFVDRMVTRRAMIDQYLDGKLPTLDQIDYQTVKPGMFDKLKVSLHIDKEKKKAVVLEPTPELIDVLWGDYLATGSYAADREGDQAPAALQRQGQCRQSDRRQRRQIHAGQQRRARHRIAADAEMGEQEPAQEVKVVLDDVIQTADTVDTVHMRKESLAAIQELKEKGPTSKRELSGWGQVGQGALSMGCVVAAATGQIELGIPCVSAAPLTPAPCNI